MATDMKSQFNHIVDIMVAAEKNSHIVLKATPADYIEISSRLELAGISNFSAEFDFKLESAGAVRVTGRLMADIEQASVISLKRVSQNIREDISFLVAPQEFIDKVDAEEDHPLFEEDIEPWGDGHVDIGEIAVQYLSLAMDPFPRLADEILRSGDIEGANVLTEQQAKEAASPFATLKTAKDKN
jgi:uncharacterized metal-binding protein YceD (DUF177 family)